MPMASSQGRLRKLLAPAAMRRRRLPRLVNPLPGALPKLATRFVPRLLPKRGARKRRRAASTRIVVARLETEHQRLVHVLRPVLLELARIRSRRALEHNPLYQRHADEIDRVLTGFEWDLRTCRKPGSESSRPITAVAWNVERGKRFDALRHALHEVPDIRNADLLLLTELDIGMGRSDNRNVPQAIAAELGLGYVFANYHLVLARGDSAELDTTLPNDEALHGAALLTRWPVRKAWALSLPEFTDKFHAIEKRLGSKRALVCELDAPGGPLTVAVVHLDPFAPPRHRARQLRALLAAIERTGAKQVLVGGDFNTNTYHLGSKIGLGLDIAHKLARFGVTGTVEQYMTPERVWERAVFMVMGAAGYSMDGFTDPHTGTLHYDLKDPEIRGKSLQYLPRFMFRWLERKLQRWDGRVPLRIDHFAGRGLQPVEARTLVDAFPGGHVSDHAPIVLRFTRT